MVEQRQRGERGEGRIEERENGGFRARITIKGVSKSKVCGTRQEARDAIRAWKNASDAGTLIAGSKMSLGECIRIWLAHEDTDLTISTAQGYQQKVDAYLKFSPVYDRRLDQLTAKDIRGFIRSLEDGSFADKKKAMLDKQLKAIRATDPYAGKKKLALEAKMPKKRQYSSSVQRQCYAIIRSALNWAAHMDRRLVSHNVALDVKLAGAKTNTERDAARLSPEDAKHGYVLSPEQFQNILAAIQKDQRTYAMRLLQVDLGLRPGEYLGVCVDDIDFKKNVLTIRRQVQHATGKGVIIVDRVKTDSGEREIHLPEYIADALRRRIAALSHDATNNSTWKQYEFDGHKYNLVFTQANGSVISQRLDASWWAKMLTTGEEKGGAGFAKPVRRYVARHHAASTMVAARDADIMVISTTLGHADPSFTLRRYGHALDEKKAAMAASMNNRNANRVYNYREDVLDREAGRMEPSEMEKASMEYYTETVAEQEAEQERRWEARRADRQRRKIERELALEG